MKFRFLLGSVATCVAVLLARTAAPAAPSTPVVAGVPAFVRVATSLGPAPPSRQIHLVVHLPYPDASAVRRFVRSVSDPGSPSYQRYLTPEQFDATFAPTPNSYSTVEYVAGQTGMNVVNTYADRKVVDVVATVGQAEALFGTLINLYSFHNVVYYANGSPARVPQALAGTVIAVSGFTNFLAKVAAPPNVHTSHALAPRAVEKAYDEPIFANPQLRGTGTTIAIETAYDFLDGDLTTFLKTFGITRGGTVTRVALGDPVDQQLPVPSANDETTLDVEQTAANAPGANVLVYEASDALDSTFDDIYAATANDPRIDVVTTSFGSCEAGFDPNEAAADEDLFEQAAAEGQTRFAAAGDLGSHDCGQNSPPFGLPGEPNPNTVDFPASSPNITAAGGTTLRLHPDGSIASQTGWAGSGGGVSALFGLPFYQNGVAHVVSSGRNVPDLALAADPATPYAFCSAGSFARSLGGTSAVAPNLAALFAQLDQAVGHRQGLAQGPLYAMLRSPAYPGSAFSDIVRGSNGAYRAGAGYDRVTGAGSLFGAAYLRQLPQAVRSRR